MLHKLLLLAVISFFLVACDETPDTCKSQSARKMEIDFYASKHGKVAVKDSTVPSIVAIHQAFDDTVTISKKTSINLPLSQLCDSSIFDVTINYTKKVTLYVYYKRDMIFENYTCGFRYNFTLDTVYSVPQFCDSIKIVQSYVSDVTEENCRFYFNHDTTMYK
jgi:hypothetical protein